MTTGEIAVLQEVEAIIAESAFEMDEQPLDTAAKVLAYLRENDLIQNVEWGK